MEIVRFYTSVVTGSKILVRVRRRMNGIVTRSHFHLNLT